MARKLGTFEDDLLASSDDDAPEEMGMSAGKNQSLSQAKKFREQEKVSREVEKEKRRKRNEMFKVQKEKKLENINKRALALPADVLEAVAKKSAKVSTNEGEEIPENAQRQQECDDNEDEQDRLSDSGVEDDSNVNEEDYIPLSSSNRSGLNVVTLQNFTRQKKSASDAALEFRNSRLFGTQCATRESAKHRQAKKQKSLYKCQ